MQQLHMALWYYDQQHGLWSLNDLVRGAGWIDPENTSAEGFGNLEGCLRMYADRIYAFLDHYAAHDLLSYVNFLWGSLIASLAYRPSKDLEKLAPDRKHEGFKDVVGLLYGEDTSRIIVQDEGESVLVHYLNDRLEAPEDRLSPYFRNLAVPKPLWRGACFEALQEYFLIARRLIDGQGQQGVDDALVTKWTRRWEATRDKVYP